MLRCPRRARVSSPLFANAYPHALLSVCGCIFKPRLNPRSLDHSREASSAEGAPLSEVNTRGDLGSCSHCRRRERSSSPRIGCVLGVPCFARRTCSAAFRKSTSSHRRSVSSGTRRRADRPQGSSSRPAVSIQKAREPPSGAPVPRRGQVDAGGCVAKGSTIANQITNNVGTTIDAPSATTP
jgi:hypothetical protein